MKDVRNALIASVLGLTLVKSMSGSKSQGAKYKYRICFISVKEIDELSFKDDFLVRVEPLSESVSSSFFGNPILVTNIGLFDWTKNEEKKIKGDCRILLYLDFVSDKPYMSLDSDLENWIGKGLNQSKDFFKIISNNFFVNGQKVKFMNFRQIIQFMEEDAMIPFLESRGDFVTSDDEREHYSDYLESIDFEIDILDWFFDKSDIYDVPRNMYNTNTYWYNTNKIRACISKLFTLNNRLSSVDKEIDILGIKRDLARGYDQFPSLPYVSVLYPISRKRLVEVNVRKK